MTHVPAYYRARRDAQRAWAAMQPQYVIPGLLDQLDEPVVGRDGSLPPDDAADAVLSRLPKGTVPPSHDRLTSGAEPGYPLVGTDGNPSARGHGSAVAADALAQSASAPSTHERPDSTPPIKSALSGRRRSV